MTELKIGFQAKFYSGEELLFSHSVKETYEQAEKDIKIANDEVNKGSKTSKFSYAVIEKVFYRH